MICIFSDSFDPSWNLALEEYCLTGLTQFPEILMLWQNDRSVIVGRNQNVSREIDICIAKEQNIKVVRRSTGGGAVYHDLGNINYSLIFPCLDPAELDLAVVSAPVLEAIRRAGVPATLSGRNDLLLNGKKISGTAQTLSSNRLLHHGTLLYDSDLSMLGKVLMPDPTKLKSKGIKSVRSRVTNIRSEMGWDISVGEFTRRIEKGFDITGYYTLNEEDMESVKHISAERYGSEEWNYRKEPDCEYHNRERFNGGMLELFFSVHRGKISSCRIEGDFLGLTDVSLLEERLAGCPFDPKAVSKVLSDRELALSINGITAEEFVKCMFNNSLSY